jgi:hypothetical protein
VSTRSGTLGHMNLSLELPDACLLDLSPALGIEEV